jgi:deazaflavin-dependent oxidoreductase (nitroreductase family)
MFARAAAAPAHSHASMPRMIPRLARLLGNAPAGTPGGAGKRRVSTFLSAGLVNPAVRALAERGLAPGVALLETTGRRSGLARRTPVGNGLRGDTFWIVTEHGYDAAYVRNIQADPRVRVNVRGRWRAGTAHILPDEDPYARLRELRRPLNDSMLLAVGTRQLVIRVDLGR